MEASRIKMIIIGAMCSLAVCLTCSCSNTGESDVASTDEPEQTSEVVGVLNEDSNAEYVNNTDISEDVDNMKNNDSVDSGEIDTYDLLGEPEVSENGAIHGADMADIKAYTEYIFDCNIDEVTEMCELVNKLSSLDDENVTSIISIAGNGFGELTEEYKDDAQVIYSNDSLTVTLNPMSDGTAIIVLNGTIHVDSNADIDNAIDSITNKMNETVGSAIAYNNYIQDGLQQLKTNKKVLKEKDLYYLIQSDSRTYGITLGYDSVDEDAISFSIHYYSGT